MDETPLPKSNFISLEDFIAEEKKMIQEVQNKANTSEEIASWALKTTDSKVEEAIRFLSSPWEFEFNSVVFARISRYIIKPRSIDLKLAEVLKTAKELNENIRMVEALKNFIKKDGWNILVEKRPAREEDFRELHSLVASSKRNKPTSHLTISFPSFWSLEEIFKASWAALLAGCDTLVIRKDDAFSRSAALRGSYTICRVLADYHELSGRKVGFGVGGEVEFHQESMIYLALVQSLLGLEWIVPEFFYIARK